MLNLLSRFARKAPEAKDSRALGAVAFYLAGRPLWFSINSIEGEAQPGDATFASAISTNLRKLNDDEMRVLARHGGSLLASRIHKYAPELAAVAA